MRSPIMLGAIVAALIGANSSVGRPRGQSTTEPDLAPAKAVSGNKGRLLERYERRQERIKKRSGDRG